MHVYAKIHSFYGFSLSAIGLVGTSLMLVGCGAPDDRSLLAAPPAEPVAQAKAPIVDCSTIGASDVMLNLKKFVLKHRHHRHDRSELCDRPAVEPRARRRNARVSGVPGVLQSRLSEMVSGVRCGYWDHGTPVAANTYTFIDIACADVNTGLYASTTFTRPDGWLCREVSPGRDEDWETCFAQRASQIEVNALMEPLRRNVLNQMPVFEVQAAIETLQLYTHPLPDLTTQMGRIPMVVDKGLCLDVPAANSTAGTALEIYPCNGTAAQQFWYDRQSQTLRARAIDKCVQVRPRSFKFLFIGTFFVDNIEPGAIAEIADCTNPPIARQTWSFDPEQGTIRSAFGTVLDVSDSLAANMPVRLASYGDASGQRWYSDRTGSDCSALCAPMRESACTGSGSGMGACRNARMTGCGRGCMAGP